MTGSHEDKKEQTRAKLAQDIARMMDDAQENWPMRLQIWALQARETRAQYLAYVKEGFTDAQAIELCKRSQ